MKTNMLLTICMIVKNEAEMLKRHLPNLTAVADEVIVVDTGSSDETVKVAKELGARLFKFAWIKDFAAARNHSLQYARSRWIMCVDADELVQKEDLLKIREWLKSAQAEVYALPVYECERGELKPLSIYFRPRIFRHHLGYHYVRPINEQLADAKGKVQTGKETQDPPVYHFGAHLTTEKMEQKRERNIELFEKMIKANPADIYFHFLLANNYQGKGLADQALAEYEKVLSLAPASDLAYEAMIYRAIILNNRNQLKLALDQAIAAVKIRKSPAVLNILGNIFIAAKQYDHAREALEEAATLPAGNSPDQAKLTAELRQKLEALG